MRFAGNTTQALAHCTRHPKDPCCPHITDAASLAPAVDALLARLATIPTPLPAQTLRRALKAEQILHFQRRHPHLRAAPLPALLRDALAPFDGVVTPPTRNLGVMAEAAGLNPATVSPTPTPGAGGWSVATTATIAIGAVLAVLAAVALTLLVVQRRRQRAKPPLTIKKLARDPLAGVALLPGGLSNPGTPISATSAAAAAAVAAGLRDPATPFGAIATGDGRPRKVLHEYEPVQPDEIVLNPGDFVEVSVEYDDGWGTGKNLSTGRIGAFPVACLEK
ncbi:hypothetical protein HDU96_006417 [Phlyctochytrium bullatum]|nr:hypothetical protein HDU96_006417 [Phlyctochytrium bullatum]